MDESNPYLPPRSPLSEPSKLAPATSDDASNKALLVGAIVGSCLLIPAFLAVFVMGRDPKKLSQNRSHGLESM
jgi:hypothetical protein